MPFGSSPKQTNISLVDALRVVAPFTTLDAATLAELAAACVVEELPAGTVLWARGAEPAAWAYVLRRGGIRLCLRDADGQETLLGFHGEGSLVADPSLLHGEPPLCDAETLSLVECVKIPRQAFMDAAQRHPGLPDWMLRQLSRGPLSSALAALGSTRRHAGGEGGFYLFSVKVGELVRRPCVTLSGGIGIRDAAAAMLREGVGSLLLHGPDGAIEGIVTDKDLRRALAVGCSPDAPSRTIMSAPVATIEADQYCFEALLRMMRAKIHHLAVTRGDVIAGMVTSHDIMIVQGNTPLGLLREISLQQTVEGLHPLAGQTPELIRLLVRQGARAGHVARMITVINDAILDRLLTLLQKQLGPPPVPFCWLLMGSEGRREQTLATDQDNALVFEHGGDDILARAAAVYFEALAGRATAELARCGFPLCKGGIMASNPSWRLSLTDWQALFTRWIAVPEPMEVLHSTIFFDFRGAYGHGELAGTLRRHVTAAATGRDVFFRLLAADCLKTRPPLTLFNTLALEKSGERKNTLDLKHRALVPFIDFARIMALRHGVRETGTLDRLQRLSEAGHLPATLCRDVSEAFEFLQHLRLMHQLGQIEQGREPDNHLAPQTLSGMDRRRLKDAVAVVGQVQSFLKDAFRLYTG